MSQTEELYRAFRGQIKDTIAAMIADGEDPTHYGIVIVALAAGQPQIAWDTEDNLQDVLKNYPPGLREAFQQPRASNSVRCYVMDLRRQPVAGCVDVAIHTGDAS